MSRGRLISFEGLDGAGKTTQMALLEQWLQKQKLSYLRTREPGGTPLGNEIRSLLLNRPELAITPLAEAFLFQADRAQHFAQLILPALEAGTHVVTDRCLDSSIVYQGIGRDVGVERIEQLSLLATQGHLPDLTILLDLDSAHVHLRTASTQRGREEQQNRFDTEAEQFHQRLRQAFLAQAHLHPERIKVLNAAQTPEQVQQEILALVEPLLSSNDAIEVHIETISSGRERFLDLLLLADPEARVVQQYLQQGQLLVLFLGAEAGGVIHLLPSNDQTIEVKNIAIKEGLHGRGYGTRLLQSALALCREQGYQRALVGTGNSGTEIFAFYQRAGFRFLEVRRDFFTENYTEPIFEHGIQCRDMIFLDMDLTER